MNRHVQIATAAILQKSVPDQYSIGMQRNMVGCTVQSAIAAPMRWFHQQKPLTIINLSNTKIATKQSVVVVCVMAIQKVMTRLANSLKNMEAVTPINRLDATSAIRQSQARIQQNGHTVSSGPLVNRLKHIKKSTGLSWCYPCDHCFQGMINNLNHPINFVLRHINRRH